MQTFSGQNGVNKAAGNFKETSLNSLLLKKRVKRYAADNANGFYTAKFIGKTRTALNPLKIILVTDKP